MRYAVKSAPAPAGAPNEFVMSDGSVDRMGDVVDPAGWDLKNFKAHPIALLNHDRDQIIGKWVNVKSDGKQLRGTLELADEGTSPLVDNVRKLVAQNILRAVSVGFRPIEQQPLDKNASEMSGDRSSSPKANCSNVRWSLFPPTRTRCRPQSRSASPIILWPRCSARPRKHHRSLFTPSLAKHSRRQAPK